MKKKDLNSFKFLLELEGEKRISGNNLFDLLDNINKRGSISRAASALGFSYRYAWGLLREAEKALNVQLVEKQAGGASGGGASLTLEGSNLLEQYRSFRDEVEDRLQRFIDDADSSLERQSTGKPKKRTPSRRHLLMASTMEPVEAGLLDVLEEAFYRSTGILVKHIAVGSGRALEIAREGKVDMVLTHAPDLEEEFMSEGLGARKIPLMANDFVLVGPSTLVQELDRDFGITGMFKNIALSRFRFVSRGDQSGTHLCEQKIWEAAGVAPSGDWYMVSPGVAGNLGILSLAKEKEAFTLVDRASYILSKSQGSLEIVKNGEDKEENSSLLNNILVLITVNYERLPNINNKEADRFARWLLEEGKNFMADFGKERFGEPLFYFLNGTFS